MTPDDRAAALLLVICEEAFKSSANNGSSTIPADLRQILDSMALTVPSVAGRLPHVRRLLSPVVSAYVASPVALASLSAPRPAGWEAHDGLVTVRQAARMLRIGEAGVRAALQRKRLPGAKENGRWRIRISDVERYGRQRRGKAGDDPER